MKREGLTLFEVLVIIVVIGILAALFLPPCGGGIGPARRSACENNLHQLCALGMVYASAHKGAWPVATGSELWLCFTRTSPPLIQAEELEVLACPVRGEWEPGQCDFLGPQKPWSELKPGDALGACKPGNHGEDASGRVLLKDGRIEEYPYTHPIWKTLAP